MDALTAEISAVKDKIKTKEEEFKKASDPEDLSFLRQMLLALQKKENLLLEAQLRSAAAGPGPGSMAAAGVSARLALEERTVSLLEEMVGQNSLLVGQNSLLEEMKVGQNSLLVGQMQMAVTLKKIEGTLYQIKGRMQPGPDVEVTPSICSSGQRKQVETAVGVEWTYLPEFCAPCCISCEPWRLQADFRWSSDREDAKENVQAAVRFLQGLAPPGVVVLPVQAINWLGATVHIGGKIVAIKSGKTDYIFVLQAAWAQCQKSFDAELVDGWELRVKNGASSDALRSMLGSIIGLYEAKTEKGLQNGLLSARAQAMLEYLAINYVQGCPTSDVIVVYGDFIRHYVVHAGRQDAGKPRRSLHVAGPARLPAVEEQAPATADAASPKMWTLGFIRAMLAMRRAMEADSQGQGADNSRGEGASGSGGGAASSRGGEAYDSGQGASGGSNDVYSGAAVRSGGGEGPCSSGADSSAGGGGRCGGDEGLMEAARDNAYAQACILLLQRPEVYEPLGFKEPPTSFQPPTTDEYLAARF